MVRGDCIGAPKAIPSFEDFSGRIGFSMRLTRSSDFLQCGIRSTVSRGNRAGVTGRDTGHCFRSPRSGWSHAGLVNPRPRVAAACAERYPSRDPVPRVLVAGHAGILCPLCAPTPDSREENGPCRQQALRATVILRWRALPNLGPQCQPRASLASGPVPEEQSQICQARGQTK